MEEEITEEQRRRAEASRAAALAKRKAIINESNWNISKCRKLEKFCARLEICSPDSFLVTPLAVQGFTFPGQQFCFQMLTHCLSTVVVSRYTQSTGGEKACVYKLEDYQSVLRTLKSCNGIDCEEIPWGTYNVIERLSHSYISGKWIPCRPEHLPDDKVDQLISKLPKGLLNALLPFQLDGVRFGVRRGGRCLIADEMGLGKTLQAIAIAGCFMKEGSILVVCPAILRYTWAEELERWFPYCLPTDIHLVFGHQDNPARLPKCPKVVVTSYTMLRRLQRSMLEQEWVTLIVDESHHLHCTKRSSEKEETCKVCSFILTHHSFHVYSPKVVTEREEANRCTWCGYEGDDRPYDIFHQINMLWPGLLGQTKYEYAKTYCSVKFVKGCQGKVFQDFSKGVRLEELNVLLKQSVMIRRLKEHVLPQLPPKRRQIINLVLRKSDVKLAMTTLGLESGDASEESDDENAPLDNLDENHDNDLKNKLTKRLSALGVAKLPGFFEWLSIHPIMAEMDGEETREESSGSQKMIIFSYHHKVLDGVQAFLCEKGIQFVRIDCNVTGSDRHSATQTFQYSKEVRIALIGIRSGGSGLNLTAADNVVFVELPLRPADIQQAEDRAHRHGQRKLVNIYIFCAKDTVDELHWRRLNRSLLRVSSTVNGKYGAIREIEVESVCNLETTKKVSEKSKQVVPEVSENNIEPREELMKFEDSCFSKDLKPVALSSGSSIKLSCGGENECNVVLYKKSKLQFEKHTISRNDESSGRAESEAVLCSHSLKKSNDGKRQKVVSMFPQTKLHDDDCTNEVEYGVNSTVQATPRFEVSRYTGRIHLYSCISGTDLRPKPLFVNFRQEEVECHQNAVEHKKMTDTSTEDNELYREALIAFITEWKKLRPIEKKKLTGKPLQLPLSYELCYLNESLNHDIGGLLRGGSKRRKTPRDEISYPLPSNAAWRKVNLYGDHDQKEKLYTQGWSEVDEPLCKLCQTPCKKNNAKVPQFFEDLFCSLDCFEEYRSRTSSRFLREELFKIEKGICADCRLDCHRLVEHLRPLSLELRQAYIRKEAPNIAKRNKLLDKLVQDPIEGNAWHADHIIPVYKGGGECKLENMRTLCVACHSDVTTAQCAERRIARNKAKKQLKDIMNGLINAKKSGQTNNVLEDCDLRFQQNREDHDLLIEIPGSAYSGGNLNVTKDSNQEQEVPPNQCTNYLNPGSDEPLKLSGNAERLQELDNLCDPESSCINRKQASGVETGTKGGEEQQGETLEFTVIDKR